MTKFVKALSGRPIANDQTSDSDLGVDALRAVMGDGSLDSPAPTVGISTPADDVGTPGFEIGISAPTVEVVSPGDAPAGDDTSSRGAGRVSEEGLTWDSLSEITPVTIADDHDEPTNQKGGGATVDPRAANPPGGNIGELLTLGTNPDGSHFFSGNRNVDAILIGSKWGTTNLTYSFPTSGSNYNGATFDSNGVSNYHIDLGTQQQAAARAAFAQLSAATGLTFTEITDTDSVHANIRISQSADNDVGSAYGNFPSDTKAVAGDIWFGRTNQPYYDTAVKGTWGFATMMHEIGHTMGLKHGHQDYTNIDLSFYFGTFPRVGSQSLTPDRDGQAWSLMTYTPAPFTNSNFAGEKINQPQTYMQYDLAALQYMYGANFNTNNTDSVYTFSQTTGEMFINGVGQGAPSGNKIFLTIWDGGGNDRIDASNYANGVTIDLRPGEFSTVDQAQLANNLAYQNLVNLAPGNFAMSLLYNNDARSLIENATGGGGNDIFVGNMANNVLDGGAGSDTVIFTGTTGVTVTLNDSATDVIVNHDGETDTLRSIENIQGTIGNDVLTGNSLSNTLSGGAGGADNLSGGGGADRLIGGGFTTTTTLSAPSQPDITKLQTTNNNSIANAVNTAGFYDVDANPDITNSTGIPHATINAVAFGGAVEYYRIDVTAAGTQAIFDIDGGGTLDDSILELINSGGTVLASNDTGSGDATFPGHDDAYLTFTFTSAGTYYIRVGRWTGTSVAQPMLAGQSYQLNISLQNVPGITTTITANNTSSLVADGGEGNDVVLGTIGSDTLTGGNGNDTVSFVNAFNSASNGLSTTGVTVDLNQQQGAAQNTVAAGNDTLLGFENVIGSALNDTLTGDANDNFIEGGLGNDTMVGGNGNDTASYAGATAGVTVSLALQGSAQSTVNAGTDTLSGFENLLGSGFADSLTGDATANILTGGAGDDTLNPGANAGGTVDLLDGGIGTDTASFAGNAAAVTATLNGALDGAASIAGGTIATLRSIENLIGSANADTLTGDANDNAIEGGLGDDVLDGGLGVDTLRFTGSTAVTINLATLTAQATGWGNDTITGFENVRTGSGVDNVTGDGNDNTFFDGGGNDTYNGAGGLDTVDYSASSSSVSVDLFFATTGGGAGTDTLTNIENVVGAAAAANSLFGNSAVNRLTGGSAADQIWGDAGADVIIGGAGNDTLIGDVIGGFSSSDGNDVIDGGAGGDLIVGGAGNDTLRGGDGDDQLVGGLLSNTGSVFTNDGGQDTFDGGDGLDIAYAYYTSQTGAVVFDLRSLDGNSAITVGGVAAGSFTSIERVIFRGGTNNDDVHGTGYLDTLVGNAGNDILDGYYGNDTLSGGAGDDSLIGGEGLDTATYVNATTAVTVDLRIEGVAQNTGGEGIDTLFGIEYLTGSGFGDTLRGNDDFNLIIDNAVAATTAPFAQTDSLYGYGGNDSILVTRSGTTSANTAMAASNVFMDGGDGDDLIQFVSGTVTFNTNQNGSSADLDGLSSGATYVAPGRSGTRFLDNVTVLGGDGNDRVVLTGVDSAVVDLGTGNDTLSISTLGASTFNDHDITTGSGQDTIWFAGTSATQATLIARANVVRDFTAGNSGDRFEFRTAASPTTFATTSWVNTTNFLGLTSVSQDMFDSGHLRLFQSGSDLLFQVDRDGTTSGASFVTIAILQGGYTGGFTTFNFDGMIGSLNLTGQGAMNETLTGASKADTLSGGDGNDVLHGLDGNDTLNGGTGEDTLNGGNNNDTLNGGTGNDNLNGGAGFDTATYAGNAADYTVVYEYDGNGNIIGFLSVTDNVAGDGDEGHDTLSSVEAVSFAGVALNATQPVHLFNGAVLIGTFTTIQAAVNAAVDGNRIVAGAGTYAEDVNVNKDVTIEGANDGVPGDGTRGAETSVRSFTISVDGVTIDGVAVTGSANSAGIYVNAGSDNFSLVNSVLNGMTDAYGVLSGEVLGLNVTDNLLVGYGIGIYVSGGASTGTIHSNLFQGGGVEAVGSTTNQGLYNGLILETSHVAVSDNTFDDMYYSSIVITPFGPDTVDLATFITGNDYPGTLAERVIFVYPTNSTHHVLGTDANEGFDAETAQLATGSGGYGFTSASTSFDGRGGDDYAWGGELADTFIGGAGADQLFGKGGNDSLTGGADSDLIDGGTGTDTAYFSGSLAYLDTVGGWTISSAADGNDLVQNTEVVIDGGGQRNLLVRGTGYATLQAALTGAQPGDNVRLASGTYTGTVNYTVGGLTVIAQPGAVQNVTYASMSAIGITIVAADGNDTITTGAGNDVLYGGGGNDVLNSGAGNDVLYGQGGVNTMSGGADGDTYFVENGGDQVIEAASGGYDAVYTSVSYTLGAGAEVEWLAASAVSGTGAINLTGNEFANIILGNNGNNVLDGAGGADALVGYGGNDTYYVDDAGDVIIEATGGGFDAVYTSVSYTLTAGSDVEWLAAAAVYGTDALSLTGNELANIILGNQGNNVIRGGGGADLLVGYGGDDTYYVDNAGDQVIEAAGGGFDAVYTNVSYTLGAGAEVEWLATDATFGTAAINLTGNEVANIVLGNQGNNVLNGAGGADLLVGYGGADSFAFTTALGAGNVDTIIDFEAGTDKIALDDAIFAAIGGTLDANEFVVGGAAADADDRIIYESATGELFYDADGNGGGAAVLFAVLQPNLALTASDFQMI